MNTDIELLQYIAQYDKQIGRLYEQLIEELIKVGLFINNLSSLSPDELFSFNDYPQVKEKVNELLNQYQMSLENGIEARMKGAISMSYSANKKLFKGFSRYSDKALREHRENTVEAFILSRTKTKDGLNLSQRVWNYTQQTKAEFEAAISVILEDGIAKGISAEELGQKVRHLLKNPDIMYRRYHIKKLMKGGGKKDVIEWRRRVIDENGKVRFIKEDLEHTRRGVYHSARKNALRLAATEINMAYRYADCKRWEIEPFVIGIRIRLSENHSCNGKPFVDICNDLAGDYPKKFLWKGWHPRCRCSVSPILCSEKEMEKIQNLSEIEYRAYKPQGLVVEMPNNYNEYLKNNKNRIITAQTKGTLPYWIKDNYKEGDIKKGFRWENIGKTKFKTEVQKEEIQKRWDERKRKNAIIEAARIRHEKRDVEAIQSAWDNRKERYAKILKTANNVLNVAAKHNEVDITNLKWLVNRKEYHLLKKETKLVAKSVSAAKKDNQFLSTLIPDVEDWKKQFTSQQLHNVYDSVEHKLSIKWGLLPLEEMKKKLLFEINDYLGGNMGGVQQKYVTWKVSQAAYKKQLEKVEKLLFEKDTQKSIDEFTKWLSTHKTAKKVKSEIDSLINCFNSENYTQEEIKDKIFNINQKIEKLEKGRLARLAKNNKTKNTSTINSNLYTTGDTPFTDYEKLVIKDYEEKILNDIFKKGKVDNQFIEIYHDYILSVCEKYYDQQISIYSDKEQKEMHKITSRYLSRKEQNPHYIWGASIGGSYDDRGYRYKILSYLPKLKNVTEHELSIIQRFTNGSTFSNCYNLYKTSPYWRKRFLDKVRNHLPSVSERKEMFNLIEEWSVGANHVLDKMLRYRGITFRGLDSGGGGEVRKQLLEAFNNGKPWINNASCSTSMKHSVANGTFDGDTVLVIHNKTGAYIHEISEYGSEYEVMTIRGAKYKVLTPPTYINNRYYVEIEEVI